MKCRQNENKQPFLGCFDVRNDAIFYVLCRILKNPRFDVSLNSSQSASCTVHSVSPLTEVCSMSLKRFWILRFAMRLQVQ